MSRTTGKNSPKRLANDHYATPKWCIKLLREQLQMSLPEKEPTYLCDIGAGDGCIGGMCRKIFTGDVETLFVDIGDAPKDLPSIITWSKGNFLTLDLPKTFSDDRRIVFVSNPPYSACTEIVRKTVEFLETREQGVAAFLLRLNWLGSMRRALWIQDHPPSKVMTLVPRPSFTGKGTDATEYAWFFWTQNVNLGKPIDTALNPDRLGRKR